MPATRWCASFLTLAFLPAAMAQPIEYFSSQGFEAPAYQPGPLAGQTPGSAQELWTARLPMEGPSGPPWPDYQRIAVQGAIVQSGSAAVKMDAAGHPQPYGLELRRTAMMSLVHQYLVVDMDLYWQTTQQVSPRWLFRLDWAPLGVVTALQLESSGQMRAGLGTLVPPSLMKGTFQRDRWNRIRLVLDRGTSSMGVFLNGAPVGSGSFNNNGLLQTIAFYVPSRGDDAIYIDNLRIVNTDTLETCYPDCNDDGALNLADFGCFQTKFALGDLYADCNGDSVLNLADFGCFQTLFALGCP